MKFRALHDRVIVLRADENERTSGGAITQDTANDELREGEVLAIGPGARSERSQAFALDVRVGDRVSFGKWSATEVMIDGEELLIMKESDVMAVIESADEATKAE